MKKTIFVMGIIATLIMLFQASVARFAGDFFGEPSLFHGGNAGRYLAVFILISSVIALFKVSLSMAIFAASAIVAIIIGVFMDYYELIFWGLYSIVLAFLSYLAREEAYYDDDEEEFDDDIADNTPKEPVEEFFTEREMLLNRRSRYYTL